jgi:hypothetical protein
VRRYPLSCSDNFFSAESIAEDLTEQEFVIKSWPLVKLRTGRKEEDEPNDFGILARFDARMIFDN